MNFLDGVNKTMIDDMKKAMGEYPDFPKEGILFRDISPILADSSMFNRAVNMMTILAPSTDVYIGMDARGFVFASAMAFNAKKGVVMCRKAGKLPGDTVGATYDLEYGSASIELQKTQGKKRAWIVDDLCATGGTAVAAVKAAREAGYEVLGVVCFVELTDLEGAQKIKDLGVKFESLIKY